MLLCLLSFILGFLLSCSLLNSNTELFFKLRKFTSFPSFTCLISFYKNRFRLLAWYTELLSESKTQTIVLHRIGASRTIVTANPDNVEYMLKTNFGNFPKGKPFTDLLGDFLGLGIFNVDGDQWSTQRKLASHEFSARSLREFVVKVLQDEVQTRLIPILENAMRNDAVLDMQDILRRFSFDTICKVTLGLDPFSLDLGRKKTGPLEAAFDGASLFSAMRGAAPVFWVWKFKRLFNMGTEKALGNAIKVVHGRVEEMIKLKKESSSESDVDFQRSDLLSRFLEAGLDDEMVRDMVISFLLAGRDTTSSALTWLLWLLSGHMKIENKIVDEISPMNGKMGFDDLKEMDYTKACLCEAMRLYPPVVWDSKHASKDDVLPDGTPVYSGNRVTYFQYGMGRMQELWGEDRLEFKPDRWFDESGGLKAVNPFKWPIFQAGPRICLGKEMAFIQMKYVLASILSRFELVPVSLKEPVLIPMLTAYMAGGFNVRVRMRETESV